MPTNNKSIQILRGNKSSLSNDLKKTKLEPGQPFFDKDARTLQVGDGSGVIGDDVPGSGGSNLATAPYVTVKDGAINDVKIADNAAIKGSKLADASNNLDAPTGITTEKIENGAITTAKLDTQYFVKNETVVFVAPVRVPLDKGIQWSQQINPNQPWSSLFLKSAPIKSLNTKKTLILPYTDGTLATKEQIENGEIVAQTSQNATNATYAQYASEDTSKGTIEERLTSLGFKTGSLEILTNNKGRKPYVNLNLIRKEGNIVTIYYSGENGQVDFDSTNLGRCIIGKIPNEFWPSTTVGNNITKLSADSSTAVSLVKFNNEWYLQSFASIREGIFAYNLNQPHNPISDALFISNIPEIIVPEGSKSTTVTQSVIDNFNWDSIEDIPYVLIADNTSINITYDKSNGAVDRNSYSNAILHDTSSGKHDTSSGIIGIGYAGYSADLQASWNKSTKTISYTLTKYKSGLIETTEGIATVKPSVTQIRNLKISPLNIFV